MWQLVISGPGYFDTAYDLPLGETLLGRGDDNDVVLSGDLVSRKHARLVAKSDALFIEDMGSRNGSRVNGKPLQGVHVLVPGDLISVGENTLSVRQPSIDNGKGTPPGNSGIRHYGQGEQIAASVIISKKVRDSAVLRALDNIGRVDLSNAPVLEADPLVTPDTRSLVLLYRVAESLARAKTFQSFLDETTDRVLEHVHASTAVVLMSHGNGVLSPAVVRHRGKLEEGEVPVSDAVVQEALGRGAALVVNDVRMDQRFAQRESVRIYGLDQVLCIPIGEREPFLGVLYLNKKSEDRGSPLEQLLDLCTAVAHLIATGVEKFRLLEEDRGAQRLHSSLRRFHPPEIVERRVAELSSPASELPGLEEKMVSLLWVDLPGFSATLKNGSAEWAEQVLSRFYAQVTGVIFSFEGTVDKYGGDSAMGIFGAPYSRGGDALRAVRAALAIRVAWDKGMQSLAPELRCPIRIGINTGKILAGLIGTEDRLEYTAVGEGVNLAAALCASATPGQILITGKTLASIGARFDVVPLGERALGGARNRFPVFELIEEDVEDQFTSPGLRSV
jgi:class 3 adenylate cyclase